MNDRSFKQFCDLCEKYTRAKYVATSMYIFRFVSNFSSVCNRISKFQMYRKKLPTSVRIYSRITVRSYNLLKTQRCKNIFYKIHSRLRKSVHIRSFATYTSIVRWYVVTWKSNVFNENVGTRWKMLAREEFTVSRRGKEGKTEGV